MTYEELIVQAQKSGLKIKEKPLKYGFKGLYRNGKIFIDKNIETNAEKKGTLIEEIGHHEKSFGNILDPNNIKNVKQEKIARRWGYETLIDFVDLINAFKANISGRYELAKYLDVTEEFLQETIDYYKEKYGTYKEVGKYLIYFSPCLSIMEKNNLKWLYNPYE